MAASGPFRVLDIAGAGMRAERRRLEVVAANLANANTTRGADGGPYRRREVIFAATMEGALRDPERLPLVEVAGVVPDPSPFPRVFRGIGHPEADAEGYVALPNVDAVFEMVDLMDAMRSYEANMRTTRAFRSMVDAALQIGRG